MSEVDFIQSVHRSTSRDYVGRVLEFDKAEAATVAIQFGADYWDGERRFGYGGYAYDGRWRPVAEAMVTHYDLQPGCRILDVGCGKGFLLYELQQLLPGSHVTGLDISQYALQHAKDELDGHLVYGSAAALPYAADSFDLVFSINTIHNLYAYDVHQAFQEIERVSRRNAYVCVEAYRDEREKVNLLYWQLTCRAFHTPDEWRWVHRRAGYSGDYSFIYFE